LSLLVYLLGAGFYDM